MRKFIHRFSFIVTVGIVLILMGGNSVEAAFYKGLHAGDYSIGTSLVRYPDGRVTLIGCDTSVSGNLDMTLIECYADGGLRSAASWNGYGADVLTAGDPGPAGALYCGGYTDSGGLPDLQYMVTKFDAMNNLEWARALQFSTESRIMALDVSATGDVFVFGYVLGTPMPVNNAVCKLDGDGNLQWCSRLDDWYFNLFPECVAATSDGGCVVAGSIGSTGVEALVVFKLDAAGQLEWHRHMNAPFYLTAYSVFETSAGEYIIGGYILDIHARTFLMHLDAGGNMTWTREISHATDHAILETMAPTADGGLVAAGAYSPDGVSITDCLVFRMDSAGTVQWAIRIGDPTSDEEIGYGVQELPSGDIAVTGSRQMSPPSYRDFLYLRTGADGSIPGCDLLQSVTLDTTDITAQINSYFRDINVITDLPAVVDLTPLLVLNPTALTEYVLCETIEVPAVSPAGILLLMVLFGGFVRYRRS